MADEETGQDLLPTNEVIEADAAGGEGKRKKRKVALFLAYLGAGYSGMQHNDGVKTIESTLEAAITKADGISKDNAGDFYKIQWMRAARTDKGVSAVGQVVSLKMIVAQPDDGIVARINAELPPEIRVFGYRRVIGSFDARWSCDRRRYEYLIPAAAFDPQAYPARTQQDGAACADAFGIARRLRGPAQGAQEPVRNGMPAPDGHAQEGPSAVPQEPRRADPPATEGQALEIPSADPQGPMSIDMPATEARAQKEQDADAQELERDDLPTPEARPQAEASASECISLGSEPPGSSPQDESIKEVPDGRGAPVELTGALQQANGVDSSRGHAGAAIGMDLPTPAAEESKESSPFVFDEAQRAKLNAILAQYLGTHNFHNLATSVRPTDKNAKRFILSFECRDVRMIEGKPWVRIVILGQSFMLNQIRKMIGLAIAVARGLAAPDAIRLALEPRRSVNTPVAPAVGLFLDESIFESYNEAWGRDRESLLSLSDFEDDVADFKEKLLYPSIARQEAAEQCTAQFIRGLSCPESRARLSGWADLPLSPPVGRQQRGGNGSALLVGAQEGYGVPGSKQRQGTKRRLAAWGRRGGRDAGKRPCRGRGERSNGAAEPVDAQSPTPEA